MPKRLSGSLLRALRRAHRRLEGTVTHPNEMLRGLLRQTPLYGPLRAARLRRLHRRWVESGRPDPPSHVFKQDVVREYAARCGLTVLVETGTYIGDMVYATRNIFDEIHSIELNKKFYDIARKRFAGDRGVTIVHGDSGEVLGEVLAGINRPCLFWLDGHYTPRKYATRGDRETPIERELHHIAKHPLKSSHVILIDDARDYTGMGDYPSLQTLREWSEHEGFDVFEVEGNIVRISRANP